MNTGLRGIDSALKTYFTADRVERIAYEGQSFISYTGTMAPNWCAPPPPELAVPIAATMAIAGLGWLIARRNELGAAPSRTFYEAAADWLAMIVAMLFPKEEP